MHVCILTTSCMSYLSEAAFPQHPVLPERVFSDRLPDRKQTQRNPLIDALAVLIRMEILSVELNTILCLFPAPRGGASCSQFHFPDTDTTKAALRDACLLLTLPFNGRNYSSVWTLDQPASLSRPLHQEVSLLGALTPSKCIFTFSVSVTFWSPWLSVQGHLNLLFVSAIVSGLYWKADLKTFIMVWNKNSTPLSTEYFSWLNIPLQHLPLQEAVKVHAVLVVCERSSVQVLVDCPDQTQTHTYTLKLSLQKSSVVAQMMQLVRQVWGDEKVTHLRQLLKISLHGLSSRFSLHWSANTSAMSTRWGDCVDTGKHTHTVTQEPTCNSQPCENCFVSS